MKILGVKSKEISISNNTANLQEIKKLLNKSYNLTSLDKRVLSHDYVDLHSICSVSFVFKKCSSGIFLEEITDNITSSEFIAAELNNKSKCR